MISSNVYVIDNLTSLSSRDDVVRPNDSIFNDNYIAWNFFGIFLDVAQQREHDRKVAEAAVAAARLEWEKQLQQQSPKQSITTQVAPAPIQTIIHSGRLHR